MGNPYDSGFDKSEIRCLPGCAFWIDGTGTLYLGYTREGATMNITQNLDFDKADETGESELNARYQGANVRMSLDALQTTKAKLDRIVPEATLSGGNIRVGHVPGVIVSKTGKIVHRPFAYPDGSEDFVIENAVCISDLELKHHHSERISMNLEFAGLIDESAANGALFGDTGIGS